jgi:hypothetical protein
VAQPEPVNQPLLDVLAQNKLTIAEMNQMLTDASQEAERLIPKLLEQHTIGGKVKAAQLALVQRELKVAQSALWGDLGRSLRSGVSQAVLTAAEGAQGVLGAVLGQGAGWWKASLREQARAGIDAVLAKAANGIPLARSVYKSQQLASGMVDRKVSQGLLLGHNAKTIAKSVKDLIRPDVAGGVAYAAHRLARTEINNAYKTSQEQAYADMPWVTGMRWNLSKSHPKRDECNDFAEHGVYPIGGRPQSHPNCLCYLTPEQSSEDDFVEAFLAGDYNSYLDEKAYLWAPDEELACP